MMRMLLGQRAQAGAWTCMPHQSVKHPAHQLCNVRLSRQPRVGPLGTDVMLQAHLSICTGFAKLDAPLSTQRWTWHVSRYVDGVPMAAAYPRCIVPGGWYSNARAAAGDCAAPFDQPFHLLARSCLYRISNS